MSSFVVMTADENATEGLAREIGQLAGVRVKSALFGMIDVAVEDAARAESALHDFVARHEGVTLHPVSKPTLMEPIPPFEALDRSRARR